MRRFWIWILPLSIATTIVWLSSQSVLPGGISLPPPLDKFVHAGVFGLLAFVLELDLRATRHDLPLYRRHLWIFLAVSLFGATDEWHQRYVPGRTCDVLDWMADTTGAGLGIAIATLSVLWGRHLSALSWWRGSRERPDPARPLLLVADPHWGEELRGLQEATTAYPDADWLFLGDVFDVWVGLPGMETLAQQRFLEWVGERRAAGRWVGLWAGNREYFLDGLSAHFDLLGEGIHGQLPNENLVFEHGDLVNEAHRAYRFWNILSRSAFAWGAVRILPPRLATALTQRLERSLKTTSRAYRLGFPREAFRAAAAEHPGSVFITGHFHTREEEGTGAALPWAHDGAFVKWEQGRLTFLSPPTDSTQPGSMHP